jgi:hypothetical protein
MKIRLVGAELIHADGQKDRQTDMTKQIVAFRKFFRVRSITSEQDAFVSYNQYTDRPQRFPFHNIRFIIPTKKQP